MLCQKTKSLANSNDAGEGLVRNVIRWACAAILLSAMAACVIPTTSFSRANDAGSRDSLQTLQWSGRERTYLFHLPPTNDDAQQLPLVIVLHGGGGDAESAAKMTGMSAKADQENFIVVYPNGTGRLNDRLLTWNSGNCCGYALYNNVDDVGFVRALIAKLQTNYHIDAKRIYATGISNGGMMAYRLACELSDQIAAIAPVAGALNNECAPKRLVSVIAYHGTADRNVLYDGGTPQQKLESHPRTDRSVASAMAFWVQRDGCAATPRRDERSNIVRDEYPDCASGSAVVLYTIKGGEHAWPGGDRPSILLDQPTQEISATDAMWEFFAQHPKR